LAADGKGKQEVMTRMSELYPLRFEPIYKGYLWGGRRFETELGRKLDPGAIYAESWEVCDHGQEQSTVVVGPLAGTTLHELTTEWGEQLLGRHHPQQRFPLLLKYLDANKPLSVQVHPDDELAETMGLSDPGKTEAWCVLQAEPGSAIWAGFKQPVDRAGLKKAIQRGVLERYLHRFEPTLGQCVYLPAGTVHALGKGLLIAEIQQTSDNTFRLYDWNRIGPDGKSRPLHIEQGLEATDYAQGPILPREPEQTDQEHIERLVHCDQFVLDRWHLSAPRTAGGDGRCHIMTVLDGSVDIRPDPAEQPLQRGGTALLPAEIGSVELDPTEGKPAVLLDAYLP
jgi:mannose-6-phosphate isomerase